ncbi:MAG: tetratricopeptide repeat protein [Oligoflexia bacterium]|nr:tetratricopeptide repeat protein [Oligoflexia bacterium]
MINKDFFSSDLYYKTKLNLLTIIFIMAVILFSLNILNFKFTLPAINIDKQVSAINFNKNILEYINLGNKRMIVSWLWIQTLIESDISHYKKNDLNSWMYLRFDTITTLDPLFYTAYSYGGLYLSVIKDDLLGAKLLLEKGLKNFPKDFALIFYYANLCYFELNDINKAIEYFSKIESHPQAPSYLRSLLARMKATVGDSEAAFNLLFTSYNMQAEKSPLKERYQNFLYAIRAEIDLNCLNSKKNNCNKNDFLGAPYIRDNLSGIYKAQNNWTPFKIKEKK